VNIFFGLWAAFTIPARHSRTSAWGIWFILPLVNIIGFWVYAFTLHDERVSQSSFAEPTTHVGAVARAAGSDPITTVERLAALKDAGVISESEFEDKKQDLLGRL